MSAVSAEASWPATLRTSRLLLRPAEAGDVHAFTRLWTDPEVRRFLGGPVAEQQLALYQQHFAGRPYVFSVTTRDEAVVVGSVSVEADSRFDGRREVSYAFLPEYWGRGYGCEAVAVVVGWALEAIPSHDPSAVAVTQEANVRSRRLLESIGMQPVDSFVEFDAPQVMYSAGPQWSAPAGESSPA
ncbi:GNAT family N-acetyltransferase, partial [Streptomyces decoyicus]